MNGTLDMDRIRFIANDPNSSPEARRGARAILAREGLGADPYRDMSLEAAATPIVTEPEVQPRSMRETMAARQGNTEPMTPAEIQAAFAASDAWLQLPEQQARRAAERAQMVSEITGMPVPEAAGPRTGSPQRMQMIDGVEVPVIEGPVGESMYRLGDIRAAQEAQREAMRLSQVREANRRDMEQYGYGTNEPTDDQLAARAAVTQERMGQAAGGRQEELRIRRLAESLGVTEAQAAAAYEAAIDRDNLSPQGLGSAMTMARRALLADPKSGAVDKRAAQKEYARGVITRRAQAQSNPLEYLGREDVDDWQKMVMARRLVGSSGFSPIEMQARQNEGLQRLGERFLQGGGGRLDPAQVEALGRAGRVQDAEMANEVSVFASRLVKRHADNKGWTNLMTRIFGGGREGWDNTLYTLEEQTKDEEALRARFPHLSEDEARRFIEAAAAQTTRPAPADAAAQAPAARPAPPLPPHMSM